MGKIYTERKRKSAEIIEFIEKKLKYEEIWGKK